MMAQRLMEQGKQPQNTEMVSGYAVQQSPVAGLARALTQGLGGYMEGQATQAEMDRQKAARETMAQAIDAYSRSQSGGQTQLADGETINWNVTPPDRAGQMYANILMGNEDTADMGMQSVMGQMQAKQNMANELDMYRQKFPMELELARQKAQINAQYAKPAALPSALQVTNAYLEAVQSGDMDRANAIREFAKTQEKGTYTNDAGVLAPLPGAVESKLQFEAAGKPMPATIVQAQDELIDKVNISQGIAKKMDTFTSQIDNGQLDLGLMANLENKARNNVSMSTEESRNLASFQAALENLRNESLRLNTGVQTDGDAQRAWSELVANLNDPGVVRQRLQDIKAINERGAALQQQRLAVMRSEYGRGPIQPNLGNPNATINPAINTPVDQIQPVLSAPEGRLTPEEQQELEALKKRFGR